MYQEPMRDLLSGEQIKEPKERKVRKHEKAQRRQEEAPLADQPPRPVVNHIGVSGGRDSTALLLWALHESGYPKESLDITFCDTDNEHDITYDQIVMLSEHSVAHGGPRIQWLKPRMGFYELAKHKKRFPSARARFCTQELKIFPSQKHVKKLIEAGFYVVMHSGVRANESHERGKLVQREERNKDITEFRPLLRWTIEDVWAIHRKYGIPPNPLYAMGAKRVGCLPCIMSRKAEIALIAKHAPECISRIRDAEIESASWPNSNGEPHTFFHHGTASGRFRVKTVKTKTGTIQTASIDDVVRWATEDQRNYTPSLLDELDTRAEDRTACQSTWGSCE